MRQYLTAIAVTLFAAGGAHAQDLDVTVVDVVTSSTSYLVTEVEVQTDSGEILPGSISEGPRSEAVESTEPVIRVVTLAEKVRVKAEDRDRNKIGVRKLADDLYGFDGEGQIYVEVTAIDFKQNIFDEVEVVVEKVPPVPETLPLDPSNPQLRVVVIYETEDATNERYVTQIRGSPILRSYLFAKCAKGGDGKTPEFRMVDQQVEVSDQCSGKWCEAFKRADPSEIPWVIITNDHTSFEGPLPKSVESFLDLLKLYGG